MNRTQRINQARKSLIKNNLFKEGQKSDQCILNMCKELNGSDTATHNAIAKISRLMISISEAGRGTTNPVKDVAFSEAQASASHAASLVGQALVALREAHADIMEACERNDIIVPFDGGGK